MSAAITKIRPARPEDAPELANVHVSAWRGAYLGVISGLTLERMVARRDPGWWARAIRRRAEILILDFDDVIAGYATLGPSRMRTLPYKGEIYEIYLKPEYQGLGLGGHLFKACRGALKRYGLASLAVRVLSDNEPACRFYESLGGDKIAETKEPVGADSLAISIYGWKSG